MRELLPPLCGVAVLAALFVQEAEAQTYPSHPIQVIVPATPGGPADTAIRIIEPELSSVLGTPLVLVNRPGASGIVGMSSVATAAPNGYTIGAGVNSIFTVVHISGSTVPFTIDDFLPIGNYASDVSILAVHPDAPWRNFDELIDYARTNPGKLSYASAGVGTVSSLSMQSIISASRLEITAVPFAGGAQATMAVIGHHVDLGMERKGLPHKRVQPGPRSLCSTALSAGFDERAHCSPAANHECSFGCGKARKRRPICSLRGSQNRACAAGRRAPGYRRS